LIDSVTYLKRIASKALKRLTLDGSMYGFESLEISAPHLISFECTGCSLNDISWRDQPSLERARIDTWGRTFCDESRFTEVLVHAKELALFGSDIKVCFSEEKPIISSCYFLLFFNGMDSLLLLQIIYDKGLNITNLLSI
jgi:hypothetical protein